MLGEHKYCNPNSLMNSLNTFYIANKAHTFRIPHPLTKVNAGRSLKMHLGDTSTVFAGIRETISHSNIIIHHPLSVESAVPL